MGTHYQNPASSIIAVIFILFCLGIVMGVG